MFCTNCGAKIKEDDKFCVGCGSKIVKPQPQKEEAKNDNVKPVVNNSNNNTNSVNPRPNDSNKTVSIVLGVISIVTCFTVFIPIVLSIVGLVLAFKARKNDRNFVAGIVLNIIGIVATIAFIVLAFFGLLMIGLGIEGKLTHDWCCSSSVYTESCEIKLDLEDDYTYTMSDKYEMFETPGKWDYEWLDDTNKGDQFKLTLDDENYTAYVKKDTMRLYLNEDSNKPMLYCTKD